MNRIILGVLVLALASPALAEEPLPVEGSSSARFALQPHAERLKASQVDMAIVPVGTGQAMLNLLDGKTDLVVVTMPLAQAVAAAREAAWAEGRLLRVPELAYRPIEGVEGAAFVSLAAAR